MLVHPIDGMSLMSEASPIPCQLPLSPIPLLLAGLEHALDVPFRGLHHSDPGMHRRPAILGLGLWLSKLMPETQRIMELGGGGFSPRAHDAYFREVWSR
jgi:hypothetical protein